MKVFTILNPNSITNIYLVTDDDQRSGVLIDPGSFESYVYRIIKNIGAEIKKIFITSDNKSETAGIGVIKKIYDPDIYATSDVVCGYPAKIIKDGDIIKESGMEFKIIKTPIHKYNAISIYVQDALFVGKMLQAGELASLGESSEPTSYELSVIKEKIFNLDENTIIYPGIGPATTLKLEKEFNCYFKDIKNMQAT